MTDVRDVLFDDVVPVRVRETDREERTTSLRVYLVLLTRHSGADRRCLELRLTDDQDSYLLYHLTISEHQYLVLKDEQSLVVDFDVFPSMFIDLLRRCASSATAWSASHTTEASVAGLSTSARAPAAAAVSTPPSQRGSHAASVSVHHESGSSPAGGFAADLCSDKTRGDAVFRLVETNPFRNLDHLQLRLRPGDDAAVKRYLADSLAHEQEQRRAAQADLARVQASLHERLDVAVQARESAERELRDAIAAAKHEQASLKDAHASEMAIHREAAARERAQLEARLDAARRDDSEKHAGSLAAMQARLDQTHAEMSRQAQVLSESARDVTMLRRELDDAKQEAARCKEALAAVRSENEQLDSSKASVQQSVSQYELRVATLQAQLDSKDELLAKTTALLSGSEKQQRSLEDSLAMYRSATSKLDEHARATSAEIEKGNDIIARLTTEVRTLRSRLKLKATQAAQRESELRQADSKAEHLRAELVRWKAEAEAKAAEAERAQEQLRVQEHKIEEHRQELARNATMIAFLNKRLDASMIQQASRAAGSGAYSFRPTAASSASVAAAASLAPRRAPASEPPIGPRSRVGLVNRSVDGVGVSLRRTGPPTPTTTASVSAVGAEESPVASTGGKYRPVFA